MLDSTKSQTLHKQKPRLLEAIQQAIRRLHVSRRTGEAYVGAIRRFNYWSGKRHPATLGAAASCASEPGAGAPVMGMRQRRRVLRLKIFRR